MRMSGTSLSVLKAFVGAANAQYRAAGLGEYQMKVRKDGSVVSPNKPAAAFKMPNGAASAAGEQATAGAVATAAGAAVRRSGAAPTITGLQQGGAEAFRLTWSAVAGAKQYGVWQDGALIGHVTDPSYAGQLAIGASGTLQIDAVLGNGARTQLTAPMRATRGEDGKIAFQAAGGAPVAAAAPAPSPEAAAPEAAQAGPPATAPAAAAG